MITAIKSSVTRKIGGRGRGGYSDSVVHPSCSVNSSERLACLRPRKQHSSKLRAMLLFVFGLVGALFQFALHADISNSIDKHMMNLRGPGEDTVVLENLVDSNTNTSDGDGHDADHSLESIRNKDGIAMCLLIKDENEKLPEWLAYHFLEMPLQYLIVAVDPFSTTSPEKILNVWRQETGMDIVLWHDPHYRHVDKKRSTKENEYRPHHRRQERFIGECIRHHKARGRKWLTIIDTDEFIANNVIFGNDERQNVVARNASDAWKLQEWEKKYVLKPNQTLFDYTKKLSSNKQQVAANRTVLDNNSLATSTGNTKVERQMYDPFAMENFMDKACHLMPRITMSSVEEEDLNILDRHMPRKNNNDGISDQNLSTITTPDINSAHPNTSTTSSYFDPMRFNTLRYFHHADPFSKRKIVNGFGKVIIDLDRVRHDDIIVKNTHRPLRDLCASMFPDPDFRNKPLMVHHYMGTWEQCKWKCWIT